MPRKKLTTSVTKERLISRPDGRVPVSGRRDKLTVKGLDPNYSYRWVEDDNENGQRILEFIQGGYEFAPANEHIIGQNSVYNTDNIGSVIRKPSGGKFLFLMRIDKELYDEDQRYKQRQIDEVEKQMTRTRNPDLDDGQYGGGSVKSELL